MKTRTLALTVLPTVAVVLGASAGFLTWQDSSARRLDSAAAQSVGAARETAAAVLTYRTETVEQDLTAATDRLTGPFLESYTKLIHDVVIPGARRKGISTDAKVVGAAPVSVTVDHAVALVFIDQTITVGKEAPGVSASSVRVTLDKVGDRWLVSGFDPI